MSFDLITALGSLAGAGAQIGTGISAGKAADRQAKEARRRGALVAEDERRKGRRLAGKQRAAFAKGGVTQSGTVLDVLAQTAADSEINALRAALGFEQQADAFNTQATSLRTAGVLGAGKTLLGAGQTFEEVFAQFKNSRAKTSTPTSTSPFRHGA